LSSGDGGRAVFDGGALAKVRRRHGLTQLELAALVGYDGAVTISKIEKGVRQPSPRKWVELAEALQVDPDSLAVDPGTLSPKVTPKEFLPVRHRSQKPGFVSHVAVLDAARQARENQQRREAISSAVDQLEAETTRRTERWAATKDLLDVVLFDPFYELTGRITGIELGAGLLDPEPDLKTLTPRMRLELQRTDLQRSIVDIAGTTAASAGLGAAAGAGAAFAAYATTAAFATASTGAAISGLTGAAATSATLAALGGGSLAAGGLGVAGGVALLSGIVTAPVLLAAGIAFYYRGKKMQAQTRSDSAKLAAAEVQLRRSSKVLGRIWAWLDQGDRILQVAAAESEDEVQWLKELVETRSVGSTPSTGADVTPTLDWDSCTGEEQARYEDLTGLVATVTNVLTAPILAIADDEVPKKEIKAISEWNDLVLADSAARLGLSLS